MANNRIYLVHKPSGVGVYIGKHMGWEWYNGMDPTVLGTHINTFLAAITDHCIGAREHESVMVVMESSTDPSVETTWTECKNTADGLVHFTAPWSRPSDDVDSAKTTRSTTGMTQPAESE